LAADYLINEGTTRLKKFIPLFATALLLAFAAFPGLATAQDTIASITIQGNQRIEAETVQSYMSAGVNDPFDQRLIDESIKRLYATGLFATVAIDRKGNVLVVKLVENPLINEVAFEGNKRMKKDDLLAEITLKPRSVYTKVRLQNDVNRIIDIYRKSGRFSVTVNPKLIELPQNRVNLVFEIDEGSKTPIKNIEFIGNTKFSNSKLASLIHTKESHWYRFFSSNDTYDPDRIEFDKELLRKFYTSEGYADFKVISAIAELTPKRDAFILTYTLEEGDRYNFGAINVETTLKKVNIDALKKVITTEKGDVFNSTLIEDTIDKMIALLSDQGYAFVDIEPDFKRDIVNHTIAIDYKIQEGRKVYVNRINVNGNVRTLDEVVRREFRISENDPYNAAQIRRSEQRIRNLGFFEKVEINNAKTDTPDKVDINVDVTERSTGEINFGAGYSTTDGALANVGIRERNLLGKGQDLGLTVQKAERRSNIDLSFTEPYFMGYDISAGIDLFSVTTDRQTESSYESTSSGGTLRSSYDFTEYLRHSLRYSLKADEITNISPLASRFIRDQEGDNITSLIGQSFLYDKRDNKFNPNKGYFVKLNQDLAGLGGDSKFLRHEVRSGYFIPVFRKNNDIVLQLSANTGYIFGLGGEDVRINERFFVGGDDLRGFRTAGIGPRDITTTDALGGNLYYTASTELRFPLGLPKELDFLGNIFIDAGSLSNINETGSEIVDKASVRLSAGAGISWGSPMGPIRIDLATPIVKETFDRTQLFRFSFGTRF
jgi:outer membrane protein insertion porin family